MQNHWQDKSVIVTGGAGFIGSHLVGELLNHGANVLVIDNLCRGQLANLPSKHPRLKLVKWNLEYSWPPDVNIAGYAALFHLAAKVTGIHYNRLHNLDMMQRNLKINWIVTEALARLVNWSGLYTFVSTACVYPHDAEVPTGEEWGDVGNPEPTNWGYGVAKWVGEQQAKYLHQEKGINTMVVRFFNAFGIRDYYDEATSHVAPALIKRVLDGENPVDVWGSGEQSRALVDARDIAFCLVRLAETAAAHNGMAINIGHEREISIRELAETILHLSGSKADLVFDTGKPEGYKRRAADTTRLKQLIDYVPRIPIETTLRDMIADYQQRYLEK